MNQHATVIRIVLLPWKSIPIVSFIRILMPCYCKYDYNIQDGENEAFSFKALIISFWITSFVSMDRSTGDVMEKDTEFRSVEAINNPFRRREQKVI